MSRAELTCCLRWPGCRRRSPRSSSGPAWCGCTNASSPSRTPAGTSRAMRFHPGSRSHPRLEQQTKNNWLLYVSNIK